MPDAVLRHSDSLLAPGLSSQLLGVLQADGLVNNPLQLFRFTFQLRMATLHSVTDEG